MVNIYVDGTVRLSIGGVEVGQGLFTKMVQIASSELGIPVDKVHIADSSTDKTVNPIPTGNVLLS